MIARAIREYVSRDWRAVRDAKDAYWGERIARLGPIEAFASPRNCGARCCCSTPAGLTPMTAAGISNPTCASESFSVVPLQPAAVELLTALSKVLSRWGRWCVFGAQAVIAYGVPRLSADVDVTWTSSPRIRSASPARWRPQASPSGSKTPTSCVARE